MHPFTAAFVAALLVTTVTRWWLDLRHIRYVSARRREVPAEFAGRVPLEAHQKAADYTVAKTKLSAVEAGVGFFMALGFTLAGGIQAIADAWSGALDPQGYGYGIALIVSVALVAGLVDLPFSLYRTFTIEGRFGFNRTTVKLFWIDFAKALALSLAIGVPLLFCVLWLMERMGSAWWLYVWATLIAVSLVGNLLAPLIMGWFNKFTPL